MALPLAILAIGAMAALTRAGEAEDRRRLMEEIEKANGC
jgi:hypothetical protein